FVSSYHLAEWFAWNWWRLRWEPRTSAGDWLFAHSLTAIGNGYVWPHITIFSDGERIALVAKPTQEQSPTSFRYISNAAAIVPAQQFEASIDNFIDQIINRLREEHVGNTNLHNVWSDIRKERQDKAVALWRKFEALLGADPDEGDAGTVARLIKDAESLGEGAMGEIAAHHAQGEDILTATTLQEVANTVGFEGAPLGRACLREYALPKKTEVPAWRLGAEVAMALRAQEGLGKGLVTDKILAELAGVSESILSPDEKTHQSLAFVLDENGQKRRIVLRAKWSTGRRFELARLLGDQLVNAGETGLFPATRTHTFRQKVQRSFAAEFLAPFEEVKKQLNGDYSEENQHDIAGNFDVPPLMINTLLLNHQILERDDLVEFDTNIV
ncbi:MAG: hypothetical protein HQK55_08725, partial [Deltaproteobacteria bacterium]|nr:hypothetical protein [Deltaproteobacteria bacterium]